MEDWKEERAALYRKIAELEETVKFILKRIGVNYSDLPRIPGFLKSKDLVSSSLEAVDITNPTKHSTNVPIREDAKTVSGGSVTLKDIPQKKIDGPKVLPSNKNLNPHVRLSPQKGYQCKECSSQFSSKTHLWAHKRQVGHHVSERMNPKAEKECNICSQLFANRSALQSHKRKEGHWLSKSDLVKSHPCEICGTTFPTIRLLGEHRKREKHFYYNVAAAKQESADNPGLTTQIKNVRCNICSETFTSRAGLQKHKRVENHWAKKSDRLKPSKCDLCKVTFPMLKLLREHQTKKQCKSDPCKTPSESRTLISSQIKRVRKRCNKNTSKLPENPRPCSVCFKIFPRRAALKDHRRKEGHHLKRETPLWHCLKCLLSFSSWRQLLVHKLKARHPKTRKYCRRTRTVEDLPLKDSQREGGVDTIKTQGKSRTCQICSETFPTFRSLSSHKKAEQHFVKRGRKGVHDSYKCTTCPSSIFPSLPALWRHRREHRASRLWNCHKCVDSFRTRRLLEAHKIMKGHQGNRTKQERRLFGSRGKAPGATGSKSSAAGRKVNRKGEGVIAAGTSSYPTEKKSWSCRVCSEVFPTARALENHRILEEHYVKKKIHKLEALLPNTYSWPCEICSEIFPAAKDLEKHKRAENHVLPEEDLDKLGHHRCLVCYSVFTTLPGLRRHRLKMKHFRQVGACTCPHCGIYLKRGPRSQYYKRHMQSHSQEKLFLCGTCGAAVKSEATLRQHELYQHGSASLVRPYKCKYCGSDYKTPAALKCHEDSHERKRDKRCPQCGTICRNLKLHIREVHENVRRYKCHLCEMAFKKNSHLTRHLNSHQNPRRRKKGYHIERPEKRNIYRGLAFRTVKAVNVGDNNYEVEMAEKRRIEQEERAGPSAGPNPPAGEGRSSQ